MNDSSNLTQREQKRLSPDSDAFKRSAPLVAAYSEPVYHDVRIERRVIIRITPTSPSTRQQMLAQLPRREMPTRFEEKKIKGCIPIKDIAGTQPAHPNRLLLFMHDRRVLSVALERNCSARDFYSGFYVEKNKDGMICSGRDRLQSRTGSSCGVAKLSRLVAWQQ
ncbi:hypothetical protein GRI39_02215 [Altererythrobacter indicus]|uniref:Uncharacterized protein n=1 Tax=Altericroceibacterium indicum TaxID=374177 RepID=A0A845A3U7_9SPHN|nr:hypothetical protein [Altericroceibacterium indicum]